MSSYIYIFTIIYIYITGDDDGDDDDDGILRWFDIVIHKYIYIYICICISWNECFTIFSHPALPCNVNKSKAIGSSF